MNVSPQKEVKPKIRKDVIMPFDQMEPGIQDLFKDLGADLNEDAKQIEEDEDDKEEADEEDEEDQEKQEDRKEDVELE